MGHQPNSACLAAWLTSACFNLEANTVWCGSWSYTPDFRVARGCWCKSDQWHGNGCKFRDLFAIRFFPCCPQLAKQHIDTMSSYAISAFCGCWLQVCMLTTMLMCNVDAGSHRSYSSNWHHGAAHGCAFAAPLIAVNVSLLVFWLPNLDLGGERCTAWVASAG